MSKKTVTIEKAHKAVKAITGLTDQQYSNLMYNTGLQFAESFSRLMHDPIETYNELTRITATSNLSYWEWFTHQWYVNDKAWYDEQMYRQPISYQHYKSYMVNDESLVNQLLETNIGQNKLS